MNFNVGDDFFAKGGTALQMMAMLNSGKTSAGGSPAVADGGSGFGGWGGAIGSAGTAAGKMLMNWAGIKDNSQEGVTLNASMKGAEIGGTFVPGWGHLAGGIVGGLIGATQKGSVDDATGEIHYGGIFGRSKRSLRNERNRILDSIANRQITEDINNEFMNDPNNSLNTNVFVNAAEGKIIRRPVNALVSKGELIYDPETKKLSKVPGSKGKPNKKDDVAVKLYEGAVVVSNSPTMLMANGKTPALNLENMVMIDKKKNNRLSKGTANAREAIIKKVVNWLEANKTKPQEYAMYDEGGIAKYSYNKNLEEFAYWDKDKKQYKKEYLDWVNNLTEKDVRDIEEGKYGDMTEYFSKNRGKKLDVATAKKLMTDNKYGNWHNIGKKVVDQKIKDSNKGLPQLSNARTILPITGGLTSGRTLSQTPTGTLLYTDRIADPSIRDFKIPIPKKDNNERDTKLNINWSGIGEAISDYVPLATALFGNYDYHSEQAYINPAKYIPTGVSTEPLRRAADESYAMARYNQANINPNTGAGMAYGLQAASNRAKSLADTYQWQTEQQNKLIAQNVGIYNDWANREAQARHTANTETRQNEAAADYMRRTDIKSGLNWAQQRRRDRQILPALKQYLQYGMYDSTLKGITV